MQINAFGRGGFIPARKELIEEAGVCITPAFFVVCRAWRAAPGTALSMPMRKLSAEVTRRCKSSGGLGGRNP